MGIRHILAAPFHPQTNGKLERYHQTLKRDVNQLPYELPSDLEAAIVAFVSYYNYRRYHKALGNVTPSHVLRGRREDILRRRREVKAQTIEQRRQHNKALRSSPHLNPIPDLSGQKLSHFCGLPTHLVVERKISGGTRTKQGSDVRMVLASLYGTWRLRGLNPFDQCRKLLGYHQL